MNNKVHNLFEFIYPSLVLTAYILCFRNTLLYHWSCGRCCSGTAVADFFELLCYFLTQEQDI